MAPERSILHSKPFFFLLLLLISSSSSSSAAAAAANTSSSTTSFNIEISSEHPSSAAAAPATPSTRFSASFSFAGPAPPPAAAPSISEAAADADAAASDEMEKLLGEAAASLALRGRYLIASGALRAHRDELALLSEMTVLAPDDQSIADALYYESPPRFHLHVVPDRLLTYADLRRLPTGSQLPTLDPRESLVVTSNGIGASDIVQFNFVGVKAPDLVTNSRIAVHGVHLPISELEL